MTARLRPGRRRGSGLLIAALLGACTSGVYAETQLPTATSIRASTPVVVRHRHGRP